MTSNQIAYWNLKETERANRVKEEETQRHNIQDEYNRLFRSLGNPYSLGAYLASSGNPNNIVEGMNEIFSTIFGEGSNLGSAVGNVVDIFTGSDKDSGGSFFDRVTEGSTIDRIGDIFNWFNGIKGQASNSKYNDTSYGGGGGHHGGR